MSKDIKSDQADRVGADTLMRMLKEQRDDLDEKIRLLEEEATREMNARLNLPTDPGWYLSGAGYVIRLREHPRLKFNYIWDDGYGNEYYFDEDVDLPLIRMVPIVEVDDYGPFGAGFKEGVDEGRRQARELICTVLEGQGIALDTELDNWTFHAPFWAINNAFETASMAHDE